MDIPDVPADCQSARWSNRLPCSINLNLLSENKVVMLKNSQQQQSLVRHISPVSPCHSRQQLPIQQISPIAPRTSLRCATASGLDIYAELVCDQKTNEIPILQAQINSLQTELSKMSAEVATFKAASQLEQSKAEAKTRNFNDLWVTARRELAEKTELITRLRSELDKFLVFTCPTCLTTTPSSDVLPPQPKYVKISKAQCEVAIQFKDYEMLAKWTRAIGLVTDHLGLPILPEEVDQIANRPIASASLVDLLAVDHGDKQAFTEARQSAKNATAKAASLPKRNSSEALKGEILANAIAKSPGLFEQAAALQSEKRNHDSGTVRTDAATVSRPTQLKQEALTNGDHKRNVHPAKEIPAHRNDNLPKRPSSQRAGIMPKSDAAIKFNFVRPSVTEAKKEASSTITSPAVSTAASSPRPSATTSNVPTVRVRPSVSQATGSLSTPGVSAALSVVTAARSPDLSAKPAQPSPVLKTSAAAIARQGSVLDRAIPCKGSSSQYSYNVIPFAVAKTKAVSSAETVASVIPPLIAKKKVVQAKTADAQLPNVSSSAESKAQAQSNGTAISSSRRSSVKSVEGVNSITSKLPTKSGGSSSSQTSLSKSASRQKHSLSPVPRSDRRGEKRSDTPSDDDSREAHYRRRQSSRLEQHDHDRRGDGRERSSSRDRGRRRRSPSSPRHRRRKARDEEESWSRRRSPAEADSRRRTPLRSSSRGRRGEDERRSRSPNARRSRQSPRSAPKCRSRSRSPHSPPPKKLSRDRSGDVTAQRRSSQQSRERSHSPNNAGRPQPSHRAEAAAPQTSPKRKGSSRCHKCVRKESSSVVHGGLAECAKRKSVDESQADAKTASSVVDAKPENLSTNEVDAAGGETEMLVLRSGSHSPTETKQPYDRSDTHAHGINVLNNADNHVEQGKGEREVQIKEEESMTAASGWMRDDVNNSFSEFESVANNIPGDDAVEKDEHEPIRLEESQAQLTGNSCDASVYPSDLVEHLTALSSSVQFTEAPAVNSGSMSCEAEGQAVDITNEVPNEEHVLRLQTSSPILFNNENVLKRDEFLTNNFCDYENDRYQQADESGYISPIKTPDLPQSPSGSDFGQTNDFEMDYELFPFLGDSVLSKFGGFFNGGGSMFAEPFAAFDAVDSVQRSGVASTCSSSLLSAVQTSNCIPREIIQSVNELFEDSKAAVISPIRKSVLEDLPVLSPAVADNAIAGAALDSGGAEAAADDDDDSQYAEAPALTQQLSSTSGHNVDSMHNLTTSQDNKLKSAETVKPQSLTTPQKREMRQDVWKKSLSKHKPKKVIGN